MINRALSAAVLWLGLAAWAMSPALANGAASTRNILFGAAAAAAGTLIVINHNKKVHERYADDARRQAAAESAASNAQAAYASERRAYENEVVLNDEYKHEVATQHGLIESLRNRVAAAQARGQVARTPVASAGAVATHVAASTAAPVRLASASWGWGQL